MIAMNRIRKSIYSGPLCLVLNLVLVYVVYEVCRLAFLLENWQAFAPSLTWGKFFEMLHGGLVFDTSAILYTNALYALLMLLPLHYKETDAWQRVARWVFVVCNAVCIVANLADSVYFQYTGRRTTVTVFSEFASEHNIGSVVGVELLRHWYLVVLAAVLVWGLWRLYFMPSGPRPSCVGKPLRLKPALAYYGVQLLWLLAYVPLTVIGMRGGATTAVRPITISNANQYVDRPLEAAVVLNTPFSLIRTFNKPVFTVPGYFAPAELDAIYTPVHMPQDSAVSRRKNVVVLIVESFGREYIGGYNHWLDGGKYKGYTPFVDSLMQHSATWLYSYCNGRKSIDGMPSILSGIPMFVEPFFLTPSSMNDVSGLAGELKHKGYYSAFFHGAENGSMGFQAFARTTGFDDYFGRTEYNDDKRFGGDRDFDGMWAIWDEPFLQFYALKMSEFRQPWYKNTLFVITSDHTNLSDHDYYQTDLGGFCSPIIFFDPSGEIKPGMRDAIAQQIDIMPTVLGYLGYDRPYVAFGCDLFNTEPQDTWAVNYLNGIYQYVKGDYLLQFDGSRTKAVYRFRTDLLLEHNLVGCVSEQAAMERELKAIIQQYMTRMTTNTLVVGGGGGAGPSVAR